MCCSCLQTPMNCSATCRALVALHMGNRLRELRNMVTSATTSKAPEGGRRTMFLLIQLLHNKSKWAFRTAGGHLFFQVPEAPTSKLPRSHQHSAGDSMANTDGSRPAASSASASSAVSAVSTLAFVNEQIYGIHIMLKRIPPSDRNGPDELGPN